MIRNAGLCLSLLAVLWAAPLAAAEKAVPLEESARPCPEWGPGFVRMPGSSTCVRVTGRVRAEYGTASGRRVSRDSGISPGVAARLDLDTRSQTEFGPLRTVVRVKGVRNTGAD